MRANVKAAPVLGEVKGLLGAVERGLIAAQEEGAITELRHPPTGGEACVWIGEAAEPEAFATFFDADLHRVWLDILYVRPDRRRRGHAMRLIDCVETIAAANGAACVMLGTAANNIQMRAVVERARHVLPSAVEYTITLPSLRAQILPRACRLCDCTETHACVTDGKACHWAAPNLCSACAGKAVPA